MVNKRTKRNQRTQAREQKSREQESQSQVRGYAVTTDFTLDDCVTLCPNQPPIVDTKRMLWLYQSGKSEAVIHLIVNIIIDYEKYILSVLTPEAQLRIDNFVATALYILTRDDFIIAPENFLQYMAVAPVLNNLIAISSIRDTDTGLRILLGQKDNFYKVLPLCTVRNNIHLDTLKLFDKNPQISSLWWLQYASGIAGTTSDLTYKNAKEWLATIPEKLTLPDFRCTPLYFRATYIDPDTDRLIKGRMNECIQEHIPDCTPAIHNAPKAKRIAVLTAKWYNRSAVYKTISPHVQALKDRGYDLDLVHLGTRHVDTILERDLFTNIKYVELDKKGFHYSEIADNDYEAVYYPDIGMNNESIWLSNLRLAPIQIMGLGHPVSTFGSNIDYVITGEEVEHPDHVQNNYSERVVLIPGLGATPVDPKYTLRHAEKANPEIMINCCWTAPKINYPMLQALVEIKKRASKRVVYHFLPSWTIVRQNAAITFLRDMHTLFGKDVLITAERPYHEYLEKMESGNLSLVPHPFGGCNTVVDSFAAGLPCVALEGTKWYNRCAPGLLRRCGFDELVTSTVEDYITKTIEIIDNDAYRFELIGRLSLVDFQKTLYRTDEPDYFADAFDYLLANHTQLQTESHRKPIRIGC